MNPFSSLLNAGLKKTYDQAIDALIEGLKRGCRLYYPTTKYSVCPHCTPSNIGRQGPNPYIDGGTGKHTGACSVCNGARKLLVEQTEDVEMIVIWDYKQYRNLTNLVNAVDGTVQTLCYMDQAEKLKRATHIIFNTEIEKYANHRFSRESEPSPIGFGSDRYLLTSWKKT